jgi:hypothetical protein
MKASVTHALFIILAGVLLFIAALILTGLFTREGKKSLMKAQCYDKMEKYCEDWLATNFQIEPDWWDTKPPFACEDFGIKKPTKADCLNIGK